MKTINIISNSKQILFGIVLTMTVFFISSCASKSTTTTTATPMTPKSTPESKSQLLVKRDANNNYVIQIDLINLAKLNKSIPTKGAYMVWMLSDNNSTTNLGIITNEMLDLSKNSKPVFEGITKLKPLKVFITEEDNAAAKKPGQNTVWTADAM